MPFRSMEDRDHPEKQVKLAVMAKPSMHGRFLHRGAVCNYAV